MNFFRTYDFIVNDYTNYYKVEMVHATTLRAASCILYVIICFQ